MKSRIIVIVSLLFLLLIRFYFYATSKPQFTDGQEFSFTALLLQEPKQQGSLQRFVIHDIQITAPQDSSYHYGDKLSIVGKVRAKSGKFGYKGSMFFPKIEKKDSVGFLSKLASFRNHVLSLAKEALPLNSAALLGGIIVGAKEGFSKEFKDALSQTGTLHVVAASGMNITMLASFVMSLYIFFLKRQFAATLTIASIVAYAILAQLEASILRAAIMGIIAFWALSLGRQTEAIWGLCLAGFVMLLLRPDWLFDIGFQLSFAAAIGLLFLKPLLESRFKRVQRLASFSIVGESILTTVVAQVATLPILLANFHTVSFVSIFVNALILWTVPLVMILGGIGALVSFLPILTKLFFFLCLPFLLFFEWIVFAFQKPFFLRQIEEFPVMVGVGYYFLLVGGYLLLKKKSSP